MQYSFMNLFISFFYIYFTNRYYDVQGTDYIYKLNDSSALYITTHGNLKFFCFNDLQDHLKDTFSFH